MGELPSNDPRTQASEVSHASGVTPSTGRSTGGGERLPEGTRLGHFTVRRLIGTGGMGRVYQAQQENPRRAVAIKVMNQGLGSATALRRFEFEAQVLARLKHPGIAQIHEVGSHDFGDGSVPWFAMEYIANAKPVTDYALDAKLGLRERLKLFRQACEAIAHGHQRGVIHRDLKPSNLLVDGAGLLKVIDFGVARSTDSDMAAATLQTDVGQLVGTVQYMSPEQFDADPNDLDIRSDVYALGVVLYELLAGAPPYDLRKKPIHEAARIVREEDPARIAGLPNELNIVVSKALAKDRTQRYGSAAELSQDIERWLDGEPIAARAPGLVASMRRLVRRHRALSAAVASAFVVMAIALVVTVHLWRDAQRGWAEAERREQALKESIAAREQAEQTTKAAVQARQAADLGMLEARYAKAIGTGMAALARGDAAEVRRARRELDDLHQAGLADPSGRIETRLLAAFPAAEMRSLPLGVGQTNALVGTLDATSFLALGQSGVAFVNAGATGAPNAVPVTGPTAAAFSPDAQRLAVALGDGSMLLVQAPPQRADGSRDWKAAFTVARRLAGHAGAVRAIAWSPDGAVLASGDVTGAIRMWSGTDGAPLRSVQSGARSLRALGFTRDGASLFSVSSDGAMQRWNPANGTAHAPAASIGKPVSAVARESSSDRVAIALEDGSVEIWQADTLARQSTTRASSRAAALAFDADRLLAATAEAVERLDASGRAPTQVNGLPKGCTAVAISQAGRTVLATTPTGELVEAELAAPRGADLLATGASRVQAICAMPGLAPLAAIATNAGIEIWDTLANARVATLAATGAPITTVAASSDGRWIAGASKDGRVQLWNALTGEPAATLQREGRPVLAIAFMPGGETLIAGTATGELLRWKVASNASMPAIGGGAAITCLAARPDAAALAVAGTDGTVRLLDPNTGGTLAELPDATARGADGAPIEVRAIAFSHDGRTLACALADGTMRVWNGTDGTAAGARASGAIGEPGAAITALLADPASDTMITGSADGALRVWSFATTSAGAPAARELAKLDGGVGAIVGLSIDTDARTIACVGSDGRLALLRTQSPVSLAKARDALAAALDARRVTVQDWFAKAGPTGAVAQFDATRAGLDATQVHAVRDLLLRFGPAGSR